jgi:choline dehydrogenase-like flavoprotein
MEANFLENIISTTLESNATASVSKPFDCIIVGSGTSGMVFATELAKNNYNVLLLEAGSFALHTHINDSDFRFNNSIVDKINSQVRYNPKNDDGSNFGFLVSCFGGRSIFWGASSPRFNQYDFSNWALTFNELLPFYLKSEENFSVSNKFGNERITQYFCNILSSKNINAIPCPLAIDTRENKNGIIGGTIYNSLNLLLKSEVLNQTPSKLSISTNAFVQTVLLSKGNQAKGVSVRDELTGKTFEIYGNTVVLAAGAFESVRIALGSGIQDTNNIIGSYITEHIFCRAYFGVPTGIYSKNPEASAVLIPSNEKEKFQIEIQLPNRKLFSVKSEKEWNPDGSNDNYKAMMRSFGSVTPRKENHIELVDSNIKGGFKVFLNYSEEDNLLKEKMIQKMLVVQKTLGLIDSQIEVRPKGSSNHEAGGLIMGMDKASSVTDKFGRFHNIQNLISADAASFPSISCANLHLTISAVSNFKVNQLLKDISKI